MDFKVKDYVIYNNEGVCVINKIETADLGFGKTKYYILKPHFINSTRIIRVPVNKAESIRYPISKRKAQLLIKDIAKCRSNWINDNRKRKEYFQKLMTNGDLVSLSIIVKTVNSKKDEFIRLKKSMPLSDKNLATLCEKLVKEEIAIAIGIKVEDVHDYIQKHSK